MEQKKIQIGEFRRRCDCRFCQSENLTKIIDFGNVPLAGGFLSKEQIADEKFYPLGLDFCQDCTLVQVCNVVPAEVLFKNYFFFSSSIQTMVDCSVEFANEVNERFLKERISSSVFELGCNDGVLLKPFAAMGVKAVGVDPAVNVVNSADRSNITIVNDFFSYGLSNQIKKEHGSFDAILSSYSFAHIDGMIDVMKGIKNLLKDDGVFIFELYYLGKIIDELQYDMIYHEHFSYYSLKSLAIFLRRFNMEIFDVKVFPKIRGGSYRFYARNIDQRKEEISSSVIDMARYEQERQFDKVEIYLNYAKKVYLTKKNILDLLKHLKSKGKTIIGYGGSGRATAIMNYCGIDDRYIDYVVDDAPAKHGFFTPGTHSIIRPWDFTKESKFPDYSILFAWSFAEEVIKKRSDYLEKGGKFILPLPEVKVISK